MTSLMLDLEPSEREFLARSIGSETTWPSSEASTPLLRQVPDGTVAGGPNLRAVLLAMEMRGGDAATRLEVTVSDLWLIDNLLLSTDLRREKLADGRPLIEFAHKVWSLILEAYEDELPRQLQEETFYADNDNSSDPNTYIAEAEAILRSRHGPGTGEDLPPAAP